MKSAPKVFVGLSGGVDSSVAALRLLRRGFDVTGVFIKVWHPDWLQCNWEAERLDAMRVAAHLNIPFLTCDAEKEYRDDVAQYFISEYLAGRTPNPDVMCNKHVKFGAFMKFAQAHQADYIATGHYARRIDEQNITSLHRAIDGGKDQSYFLWTLTPEQLNYTLLPIGDTIKNTVRAEALEAKIPTALKKDSQGVCFLGHIDIKEFLSHYIKLEHGLVLNEAGKEIGSHQGALIYTIGQRHGFSINTPVENRTPYYVVNKNVKSNIIIVSAKKPINTNSSLINLDKVVLRREIKDDESIEAQSRYRQTPFRVQVVDQGQETLELKIIGETEAVAAGQSCVLYSGSECIGGGIIV